MSRRAPPSPPRKRRTRDLSPIRARRLSVSSDDDEDQNNEEYNLITPSQPSSRSSSPFLGSIPPPPLLIVEDESRVERYQRAKNWIDSISPQEICILGRSFRNPTRFSEGAVGAAFGMPSLGISAKIVKRDTNTIREIEWYNHFTQYVLNGGFPFFPLIYHTERCRDGCSVTKTYNGGRNWFEDRVTNVDSSVIFSELANGNLKEVINSLSERQLLNMFYQVFLACLELEKQGVIHNDLSPANILYFNETVVGEQERYDTFSIGNGNIENIENIEVRNEGRLWILWDFGMMVKNGDQDPRREVEMVSTIVNDLKKSFFPLLKRHYHITYPSFIRLDSILQRSDSLASLILEISSGDFEGIRASP